MTPFPEDETFLGRLKRKTMEEPLVPLGLLATTTCLLLGFSSFRKGDAVRSQLMMRARVAAQGFTVLAFVGGAGYKFYQKQQVKSAVPGVASSETQVTPAAEWRADDPK